MGRLLRWVTATHTQRYHAHYHTSGEGHLYQSRFKSFPVADDDHFLVVCRYVERNPLRANSSPTRGRLAIRFAMALDAEAGTASEIAFALADPSDAELDRACRISHSVRTNSRRSATVFNVADRLVIPLGRRKSSGGPAWAHAPAPRSSSKTLSKATKRPPSPFCEKEEMTPVPFSKRAEERQPGIVAEFVDFLVHNKKWWLTPIMLVLLLLAGLVVLGGTGAAPFIYALF